MKSLIFSLVLMPLLTSAQNAVDSGVIFQQDLDWAQVKNKAKIENKYIFVDCYATWCGPCKIMDKDVYTKNEIGEWMNTRFISLKIQMDSTKKDNEYVKQWYNTVNDFKNKYNITAYPSFLFFSPDGSIIFKETGAKTALNFLNMLKDVVIPEKQYGYLKDRYLGGQMDTLQMKQLALLSQSLGDQKLSFQVVDSYLKVKGKIIFYENDGVKFLLKFADHPMVKTIVNSYITSLPLAELYSKRQIFLLSNFITNSKNKAFEMFYRNAQIIDSVFGENGYAEKFIDYVIDKEEIKPFTRGLKSMEEPKWKAIQNSINNKYGTLFGERNILTAKISWYENRDWKKYIDYCIEKIDKYGTDTLSWKGDYGVLNVYSWNIVLHSSDEKQIKTALNWMKDAVRRNGDQFPAIIDTYANLFYKLDKLDQAIMWEEEALRIAKRTQDSYLDSVFTKTLNSMKRKENIEF